ncbi:unnamed protein product [Urochloa humidicola]
MVMPPRRSSSGMQSIRRELQRRRPKPLAPKNSSAKKPPAPPRLPPREGSRCTGPEPRLRQPREEIPSPLASQCRCRADDTDAPRPTVASRSTPPPSRSAASPSGSVRRATPSAAALLKPGAAVGVRTRITKLKTGEVLVLWLRAMVVSPTHEGCEVVYDGNWPPGDPYGTVHVPRRHVRMIHPSPTTPSKPTSCAPSPCASTATVAAVKKKEMQAAPRPTTAGKSLRLIRRSILPEMERQAQADFHGY